MSSSGGFCATRRRPRGSIAALGTRARPLQPLGRRRVVGSSIVACALQGADERVRYIKPLVLLPLVVAQHRAPVQTHFLLITIEMPQILLRALTALAGFAVGLVVPALMRPKRVWPRRCADAGATE